MDPKSEPVVRKGKPVERNGVPLRIPWREIITSGKLNDYLVEIDKQAEERFERFVEQIKQAQGITEQLKIENTLK